MYSKLYGKFEIRAKAPTGKGLWPAIWMLPEDYTYGNWAASGELDIMEGWGSRPNVVAGTIHYGSQWPDNVYSGKEYVLPGNSTIEDYHTYSIEWEPGKSAGMWMESYSPPRMTGTARAAASRQ